MWPAGSCVNADVHTDHGVQGCEKAGVHFCGITHTHTYTQNSELSIPSMHTLSRALSLSISLYLPCLFISIYSSISNYVNLSISLSPLWLSLSHSLSLYLSLGMRGG